MKKFFVMLLAGAMIMGMGTTVFAKGGIYVDLVEANGASPQIVNDRTMVPVRAITEMLGYKVNWIESKKQVEVCAPDTGVAVIIMNIDSKQAYYTKYEPALGESVGVQKQLDAPATLINDRTYVPLRFISEAVGYTVEYHADTADVYLFSPEYQARQAGEGKGEDSPSGVWDDGMGSVVPLTYEEMLYVCEPTTYDWLEMTTDEKDDFVMMVGRWWEEREGRIVEDYDEMVAMLDRQCEQYYRYDVNEYVFYTVCDLYGVDMSVYAVMG